MNRDRILRHIVCRTVSGMQRLWARGVPAMIMCTALLLTACGSEVELFGGLLESESNEVLGALLNAGIEAHKTSNKAGVSISVEQSAVVRAIDVLHQQGLPHTRRVTMGDVFKKENLISSPLEERARYLYALSQELELTLSRIDGVIASRVHIVLPERSGVGEPIVPSSAAVFLKYRPGYGVENVVSQIRSLTTNSIPGLAPDKVAVVLVGAANTQNDAQNPHLDNVLFLRVEKGSVASVRLMFASFMIAFLLALGMAIYLAARDPRYGQIKFIAGMKKALRISSAS
ncbi:type III secretion system inner membrane ring lipoprotein SctJ [Noviherbaspirillum sp.]|uniref:type III secretion system inner membrane ring lipoprotein SctJ n=1 Tax=Noviherbaspirillum sp. TaxID=1926288 RepID=UPI002B4621A7|nr:type III secretion inner membrane ring lipoprotein SctJ [Noviherbaspirillum sp.]HJV80594.1 type III secretion inner membrane ring lipoprotein SctJ [Noviherbaspirillum sp.]